MKINKMYSYTRTNVRYAVIVRNNLENSTETLVILTGGGELSGQLPCHRIVNSISRSVVWPEYSFKRMARGTAGSLLGVIDLVHYNPN